MITRAHFTVFAREAASALRAEATHKIHLRGGRSGGASDGGASDGGGLVTGGG